MAVKQPGSAARRRGMSIVKILVGGSALLLLAFVAVWAVARPSGGEARTVSAADVARAQTMSFEIITTATGELEARNQIEVRSGLETQTTIMEIVPEGRQVRKGDLLVRLNADSLLNQITEEEDRVERAKADLIAAENALKIQINENDSRTRAGKLKIELAQLALDQWREGEVIRRKQQLTLDIAQAQRQVNRLRDKFEKSEELLSRGFISQDERDRDEIDKIDAEARLANAKLDEDVYLTYQYPRDQKTRESDLEEAKAELERIEAVNAINLSAKQANLDSALRQFRNRETRLTRLREQYDAATIYAPTDGLVVYATSLERNQRMWGGGGEGPLQIGRQVRPNELLIILPDTTQMVATVRVHEALAGRIRPGQTARVKVSAAGGETFVGRVESIGVLAETGGWRDPNRREYSVRVGLDVDNAAGELKPSMRAESELTLGRVENALAVPVQAVFSDGPVRFVYVPRGSRYERTPVRVGRVSDTLAEIAAGLTEGQQVLLREPSPGEVLDRPWDAERLKSVGLALDESGRPVAPAMQPGNGQPMRMAMPPVGVGPSRGPDGAPRVEGAATTDAAEGRRPQGEVPEGRPRRAPGTETPAAPAAETNRSRG
ncbi:MAG TPA: efflux RND transporter periplasmic adaptor subunit [Phycisphaerales bacterium]|nr:efflux RND transporter periplasmic adaptor subunit [Phycisphaerales bacterium]